MVVCEEDLGGIRDRVLLAFAFSSGSRRAARSPAPRRWGLSVRVGTVKNQPHGLASAAGCQAHRRPRGRGIEPMVDGLRYRHGRTLAPSWRTRASRRLCHGSPHSQNHGQDRTHHVEVYTRLPSTLAGGGPRPHGPSVASVMPWRTTGRPGPADQPRLVLPAPCEGDTAEDRRRSSEGPILRTPNYSVAHPKSKPHSIDRAADQWMSRTRRGLRAGKFNPPT